MAECPAEFRPLIQLTATNLRWIAINWRARARAGAAPESFPPRVLATLQAIFPEEFPPPRI